MAQAHRLCGYQRFRCAACGRRPSSLRRPFRDGATTTPRPIYNRHDRDRTVSLRRPRVRAHGVPGRVRSDRRGPAARHPAGPHAAVPHG